MTESDFYIDTCDDDSELWNDQGCVLGNDCLHHDPMHSSDECFNLEMAEEYYREGMRTTEEYALGVREERERIVEIVNEVIGTTAINQSPVLIAKRIRGLILGTVEKPV